MRSIEHEFADDRAIEVIASRMLKADDPEPPMLFLPRGNYHFTFQD